MRILVIITVSIFLVSIISAQNISVSYPPSIESGRQFNLNLNLIDFKNDTYDVKIEILGHGERIAKIFNYGEWKSTYYYVNNAIKDNEEGVFQLEVENYTGNANIEIKIRDSKNNLKSFSNYSIEILEKQEENEITDYAIKNDYSNEEADEIGKTYSLINNTINNINKNTKFEPIKLNSKDIKISSSNQDLEKTRYATYSIVGFCIFLFFLFALNFLRKKYEKIHEEF